MVKYLGLDLSKIDKYLDLQFLKINFLEKNVELPIIELELNQKSILLLEQQRESKIKNISLDLTENLASANVKIKVNQEKINGKIRIKGDRAIHWSDSSTSSYRVDLSKDDYFFGMKRFSIQKPITRNYTYELLFHKLLEQTGQIHLKYFLVNLIINGQNKGIYAIEEAFSKELIERQKRRNGPIFTIDENYGHVYPLVSYKIYNSKTWETENKNLTKIGFSMLNDIKTGKSELLEHFDEDKWASYFAIIDVMGMHHGSLSKSVNLYYNPITAKFEPIGYDGHYGAGDFSNFILLDFLQEDNVNCSYICEQNKWYLSFFKSKNNELNYNFIKKYIYYLNNYSDEEFIKNFLKKNKKDINFFNQAIYSENSKEDKIFYKGLAPFIFDENFMIERSKLIKSRIESVRLDQYQISLHDNLLFVKDNYSKFPIEAEAFDCNDEKSKFFFFAGSMSIKWNNNCKKLSIIKNSKEKKIFDLKENFSLTSNYQFSEVSDFKLLSDEPGVTSVSKNKYELSNDIVIEKNTVIKKDQTFKINQGININIINNSILIVEGNIHFDGTNTKYINIISDKTGSVIFSKNTVEMNYVKIQNLGYPKLDSRILYGAINFIESSVSLKNIIVSQNHGEDGINLIGSRTYAENVHFENTYSDALDIDFGTLNFKNISCTNSGNDCLDSSGAIVNGDFLTINLAKDKGISAGENSYLKITNIFISEANVGIAVKDGSKAMLSKVNLKNNTYDIAAYNKKDEYLAPTVNIENVTFEKNKILQSFNSTVNIDQKNLKGKFTNKYINSILY